VEVGFLEYLAASARVSREQLLELHHQARVFGEDFQNLFRRAGHAIEIVFDNIRGGARRLALLLLGT